MHMQTYMHIKLFYYPYYYINMFYFLSENFKEIRKGVVLITGALCDIARGLPRLEIDK